MQKKSTKYPIKLTKPNIKYAPGIPIFYINKGNTHTVTKFHTLAEFITIATNSSVSASLIQIKNIVTSPMQNAAMYIVVKHTANHAFRL